MDSARLAVKTPLGPLILHEAAGRISRLEWSDDAADPEASALLREAERQLGAYFDGRLTEFDLPIEGGTGTQAEFSTALRAIPFGETRAYGDLAKSLGLPAQVIGQLCGKNPVPILIPCHRVLAATGLGGFSAPGGIETKVALLRHEGAASLLI